MYALCHFGTLVWLFECGLFFASNQMANSNTKPMCQSHGYYSFLIILKLNIYYQTHTEKCVRITKISAYKLDKHAVKYLLSKTKTQGHMIFSSLLYISFTNSISNFLYYLRKYIE